MKGERGGVVPTGVNHAERVPRGEGAPFPMAQGAAGLGKGYQAVPGSLQNAALGSAPAVSCPGAGTCPWQEPVQMFR